MFLYACFRSTIRGWFPRPNGAGGLSDNPNTRRREEKDQNNWVRQTSTAGRWRRLTIARPQRRWRDCDCFLSMSWRSLRLTAKGRVLAPRRTTSTRRREVSFNQMLLFEGHLTTDQSAIWQVPQVKGQLIWAALCSKLAVWFNYQLFEGIRMLLLFQPIATSAPDPKAYDTTFISERTLTFRQKKVNRTFFPRV